VIETIAKTVAELTFRQDAIFRRHLVERTGWYSWACRPGSLPDCPPKGRLLRTTWRTAILRAECSGDRPNYKQPLKSASNGLPISSTYHVLSDIVRTRGFFSLPSVVLSV
jgi:hypothetical protein